ncbi:MAG: type II toxin-antitoxin system VapC family toxin [Bacteroidetes bacterium]|nr:MAG: type II toxin-antitoxin system VapC family toxin [Bacteroidota bacterium]
MSGKRLLLDTNIVIYLAKKELELSKFASKDDVLYISSITYMECLGYIFLNKKEELIVTKLCDSLKRIQITEDVVKQTILIRKKHKIKLPDAIIAASALSQKLILTSHNLKDFMKIENLKIIDPFNF